jgi:hypothetical protein
MKSKLLLLCLIVIGSFAKAQNGLENIIVEKYYVSNAADATGSIGTLPTGSVTYRVYADMLPGYTFQAAYGVPGHELRIATSTTFFNNEDRGATTPTYSKVNAAKNTVMLDSWFSVGAACSGNYGILKSEDNVAAGGANVINTTVPPILQNNDPTAGLPLTTQDGLYAPAGVAAPQAVTFVGFTANDFAPFDATSQAGNLLSTFNASWASLSGSTGPVPATNKVLIGQFTTNGTFTFELNIQIGTPNGGVQNYVAKNPTGGEILLPSLTFPASLAAGVTIAKSVAGATCSGTSVTFTATPINGGAAPSYQWKKNNVNVGTNSPTYTLTGLVNNDQIRCVMTSNLPGVTGNPATSNVITNTVNTTPTATITTTGSTTYCSGATAPTLNANAGVGFSYQWFKGSATITGAVFQSYVPTGTLSAAYKVRVTSIQGCSKTSATVSTTVNALPTATITATGPTTFCTGTNLLTLTANTGVGFTYQWLKGTTPISGATAQTYKPTTTSTAYKVTVTNANGCTKNSSNFAVTVNPAPTATITAAGPTTFCAGDSVRLNANTGTGLTYQWIRGVTNVSGATLSSFTAKTQANYKVRVTNSNGCTKNSNTIAVTVNCREDLSEITSNDFQLNVFPVPASTYINISANVADEMDGSDVTVEFVDMLGKVIYSEINNLNEGFLNKRLELPSEMNSGIYFVRLIHNQKQYTSKFIVE